MAIVKMISIKAPIQERFWSKVQFTNFSGGCWEWMAAKNLQGYGVFYIPGSGLRLAHRASHIFARGPIDKNIHVLHHCDNRCCVNPTHLFTGDQIINNADMRNKRRHSFGEKHGMSKLSREDVLVIRSMNDDVLAARMFGIAQSYVRQVRSGARWGWLSSQKEISQKGETNVG